MEGKTEDEVVDIESASSGSSNDDSDDEESLVPEKDDGMHLGVSHLDILFHSLFDYQWQFFLILIKT